MHQKILWLVLLLLLMAAVVGIYLWRHNADSQMVFSRSFPFISFVAQQELTEEARVSADAVVSEDVEEMWEPDEGAFKAARGKGNANTPRSPECLSKEKEIAELLLKIKGLDAQHRKLMQETKKTYPFFDQDGNLTPEQVVSLRQKHAAEQLARKKEVAKKSAELRQMNLELKRKRQELRSLEKISHN